MRIAILLSTVSLSLLMAYTPPESPDKKESKKTLLGIDTNQNGIRDDVELYLIDRFKHKEVRDIAFDIAKVLQKILLVTDEESALKAKLEFDRAQWCRRYFALKDPKRVETEDDKAYFRMKYKIFDAAFRDKQFNTPKRMHTYFDYHRYLKGNIFADINSTSFDYKECLNFVK